MLIKVPFVYQASIIPAKCRKPRTQYIRDVAGVTIADLDDAVLAASWQKEKRYSDEMYEYQLFYCHGAFWEELSHSPASRVPEHTVSLEEWLQRISDPTAYGNPFGGHALAASRQAQSLYSHLPSRERVKEKMGIREYLGDNRSEEEKTIFETALRYGVREGRMFVKRNEPVYRVMTFGLGANHGATALVLDSEVSSHGSDGTHHFNLNDLDKAIRAATFQAELRKDTNSLPMKPDTKVTIHYPEAFTFNPFSRQNLDEGHISLRDYVLNGSQATEKLDSLVMEVARDLAKRVNEAGAEEQVEWLEKLDVDPESILACFKEKAHS